MEELRVLGVTASGILLSYIKLNDGALDAYRLIVLTATLGYTIYRWYNDYKNGKK